MLSTTVELVGHPVDGILPFKVYVDAPTGKVIEFEYVTTEPTASTGPAMTAPFESTRETLVISLTDVVPTDAILNVMPETVTGSPAKFVVKPPNV